MKRITKRSSIIAAVTAVALVAGGGVAFAYWTTSGSNTTTAGVASDVSNTLTVTPSGSIAGLYPGGPTQPVKVVVENPSSTAVRVSQVAVSVVDTTDPGCTTDDFAITDAGFAGLTLNPGQISAPLTVQNIAMLETGLDQDACKGAVVNLTLTAS